MCAIMNEFGTEPAGLHSMDALNGKSFAIDVKQRRIHACAWCFPGESVREVPGVASFRGFTLSHGICDTHYREQLPQALAVNGEEECLAIG